MKGSVQDMRRGVGQNMFNNLFAIGLCQSLNRLGDRDLNRCRSALIDPVFQGLYGPVEPPVEADVFVLEGIF